MKKIFILFALVLMITLVAANSNLGTFKQFNCITLKQICSNCSFVNITSVTYPDSLNALGQVKMTKAGTEYNYTFCSTSKTGEYTYYTLGDQNGVLATEAINFNVTPSGNSNVLGLFILMVVMIYTIAFFGFFGKNEWVSILGGMAMIALGIYMYSNGIDIFRNEVTTYFSILTMGIGAFFSLYAGISLIEENL